MRKLIIVLLVILGLELAVLAGYLIGYRLRKICVSIDSLMKTDLSIGGLDYSQGFFCADNDCSTVGIKGTLEKYDSNSKLISLQLRDKIFEITLTRATVVDNSKGIPFFEGTERIGDDLIVFFDRFKASQALEIYFVKTSAILQKHSR